MNSLKSQLQVLQVEQLGMPPDGSVPEDRLALCAALRKDWTPKQYDRRSFLALADDVDEAAGCHSCSRTYKLFHGHTHQTMSAREVWRIKQYYHTRRQHQRGRHCSCRKLWYKALVLAPLLYKNQLCVCVCVCVGPFVYVCVCLYKCV